MIDVKNLPEPQFVEANWQKIINELIEAYENASGEKLSKGQIERLLLDIFAYRENILRITIQQVAKQNLLAYAKGDVLDHLGALLGVERLKSTSAITTLRFYFSESLPSDLLIPKGTRVASKDNKVMFGTKDDTNVPAGSATFDVQAECTQSGSIGNGYQPGEISQIVDPVPYVEKIENISVTYGGSDIEDDDHFSERIQLAPEKFSNAGSRGAYEFWAKSAHQDIVDASVWSPNPGVVNVAVLLKGGDIPDSDMLNLVSSVLNGEKVRPLTDSVQVVAPEVVNYEMDVSLYIYRSSSTLSDKITKEAQDVLNSYASVHSEKLGLDVVPEQIIGSLQKIPGVYRAVLNKPSYTEVKQNQVAKCTSINVSIAGSVDG